MLGLRHGPADAPLADVAGFFISDRHAAGARLGHCPGLDQRHAEALLENALVPRIGTGTEAELDLPGEIIAAFLR